MTTVPEIETTEARDNIDRDEQTQTQLQLKRPKTQSFDIPSNSEYETGHLPGGARSKDFQHRYNTAIHRWGEKFRLKNKAYLCACMAECFGSIVLITFGLSLNAQFFLGERQPTALVLAMGWGMAATIAGFIGASMSEGLINPAVVFAQALIGRLQWIRVPGYIFSQFLGTWIAAVVVYLNYASAIHDFAVQHDGGQLLVNTTGSIFVTRPRYDHVTTFLDQMVSTALLAAVPSALLDMHPQTVPPYMLNMFIGLLIIGLGTGYNHNHVLALSPARELATRMVIAMLG